MHLCILLTLFPTVFRLGCSRQDPFDLQVSSQALASHGLVAMLLLLCDRVSRRLIGDTGVDIHSMLILIVRLGNLVSRPLLVHRHAMPQRAVSKSRLTLCQDPATGKTYHSSHQTQCLCAHQLYPRAVPGFYSLLAVSQEQAVTEPGRREVAECSGPTKAAVHQIHSTSLWSTNELVLKGERSRSTAAFWSS